MDLHALHINRFGTLSQLTLQEFSRGITVYWGPNGCGKTRAVQFLRGLLFGFGASAEPAALRQNTGGHLEFTTAEGRLLMLRERRADGIETMQVMNAVDQERGVSQDNPLPDWVTAAVFQEVLSPGYEEADRFELLTRLCLETESTGRPLESEIRSAETALQQALRERDGFQSRPGLRQRIADIRRRQAELQTELNGLRRPAADLPNRIQQLINDVDQMTEAIHHIDLRHAELDIEIDRLQKLLAQLRRHHTLPLDNEAIEARIRTLTARRDRWRTIRTAINDETVFDSGDSDASLRPQDSLLSVRALVARLEDRVQELSEKKRDEHGPEADWKRDSGLLQQLRAEMAALCRYLSQHEQAVTQHEQSLEHMFAYRCLTNAAQMEMLLQERIASLTAEQQRAEDLLSKDEMSAVPALCRHTLHQDAWSSPHAYGSRLRSEEDLQTEISALQSERTRLVATRGQHEETRYARRALLDRLRQEMGATATLEQVDPLRARIAEMEAQIELLEDRERQLNGTEKNLREVIERLTTRCQTRALELASVFVCRLTEGECTGLTCSLTPSPEILVITHHDADALPISRLSRGTRHQVALALRLAVIRVQQERYPHVPLILDDVFITSDDERADAVVELLTEFAAAGQQIVFFTCQKDVRDVFVRYHADVRPFGNALPGRDQQPLLKAYVEDVRTVPVAEPQLPLVELTTPAVQSSPEEMPPAVASAAPAVTELIPTSPARAATNWLFYLEVDHGVDDLAGVSLAELQALRATGIHQIDDLLQRTVSQLHEQLAAAGYDLSAARLQALRGQAELTCRVPMLRRSDAALLFASGIRSVDDLRSLRPETVFDRIIGFQKSEEGSRYRRAGRLIDRQQAINWARWGQHARSLSDARSQRSRFSTRTASRLRPEGTVTDDSARSARRDRIGQAGSTSRRRPLLSGERELNQRRARRLARRRRLAAQSRSLRSAVRPAAPASPPARPALPQESSTVSPSKASGGSAAAEVAARAADRPATITHVGGREFRFFLSRASDVEAAPSIGPRTAESLYAVGVRTVDDLLTISADILSSQLNHRRLTTSVIQQWQAQARLMCQVPELRGHDVQILVACGVTSPEDLSHRNPADLLAIVGPFAGTSEGARILRNGRKPDLAEISDWIRWAGSARAFRAA